MQYLDGVCRIVIIDAPKIADLAVLLYLIIFLVARIEVVAEKICKTSYNHPLHHRSYTMQLNITSAQEHDKEYVQL